MKALHSGFLFGALALTLLGCEPGVCERSTQADKKLTSECAEPPLLGNKCSANLASCSEADTRLLGTVLTCVEKLPVCSPIAKDAWRLQRGGCTAELAMLSQPCVEAFFGGVVPGVDAGQPDAGPQPIQDGGGALVLVGVANQDTVALAWEPRQQAMADRWLLVEHDALGDNRVESEFTPGTAINLTLGDAGMAGRRYFVVGLNAAGEVLVGTPFVDLTPVDAGTTCMGPNDCPDDRVCDLGQCREQTCPFQMANTCPTNYQCFTPGICRRTGADGGVFVGGGGRRDGGTQPLPFISNEIALTPRPPMVQPVVPVGSVAGRRPDIAALDTARVSLALEQEGQLISHPSAARGADLRDESLTSYGLDTVGGRVHLAWNAQSDALFACYVVGRGVRVQKSVDRGRTWGLVVVTFEPPNPDDGGIGEVSRDCDIAPWTNGGAIMVTAETEALVIRELGADLSVAMKGPAFTSIAPDAGTSAIFFPAHPAIAALPPSATRPSGTVHITFTGTRLLTGGVADSEPYGVVRDGQSAFSPASRLTPFTSPSPLPEDWTTVSIHPKTGKALAAYTTVSTGTQNSTVYLALFNPTTRGWSTGSHLNLFVTDQNTSVWLPQKPANDVWFAFSPQLAPLPDGTFAFSFVAGPHNGMSGDYRQYMVPFDLERTPSITAGKGWFVPPVVKLSDERVLDPRGSLSSPQPPVSALAADSQISVHGVFVPGTGLLGDVEGPANYFSWP